VQHNQKLQKTSQSTLNLLILIENLSKVSSGPLNMFWSWMFEFLMKKKSKNRFGASQHVDFFITAINNIFTPSCLTMTFFVNWILQDLTEKEETKEFKTEIVWRNVIIFALMHYWAFKVRGQATWPMIIFREYFRMKAFLHIYRYNLFQKTGNISNHTLSVCSFWNFYISVLDKNLMYEFRNLNLARRRTI
jgi:hypothetical protein